MEKGTKDKQQNSYTEVFAWGSNTQGQMGLAGKNGGRSYSIPRFCSFNVIINNLACGDEHSAFIASNGYIYTMGSNVDGKLGIASRNIKHSASPCLVEVLSRYKAVKVSCGQGHSAAVVESGELFTWGQGSDGQLGIGSITSHFSPQMVTFQDPNTNKNLNLIATDVDCGHKHTGVIIDNGDLYMFGQNEFGQLGFGGSDKELLPTRVDQYSKTQQVSCGLKHTLILTEHNKVYACGSNQTGELGSGHKRNSLIFNKVLFNVDESIKKISAGQHSSAISESGELYIWGTGSFGEYLHPHKVTGIKNPVVDTSIGNVFGAAIDISGGIYTWGSNKNGELGQGDSNPRTTPTIINSLQGKRVTSLSCGGSFTMALGATVIDKGGDGNGIQKEFLKGQQQQTNLKNNNTANRSHLMNNQNNQSMTHEQQQQQPYYEHETVSYRDHIGGGGGGSNSNRRNYQALKKDKSVDSLLRNNNDYDEGQNYIANSRNYHRRDLKLKNLPNNRYSKAQTQDSESSVDYSRRLSSESRQIRLQASELTPTRRYPTGNSFSNKKSQQHEQQQQQQYQQRHQYQQYNNARYQVSPRQQQQYNNNSHSRIRNHENHSKISSNENLSLPYKSKYVNENEDGEFLNESKDQYYNNNQRRDSREQHSSSSALKDDRRNEIGTRSHNTPKNSQNENSQPLPPVNISFQADKGLFRPDKELRPKTPEQAQPYGKENSGKKQQQQYSYTKYSDNKHNSSYTLNRRNNSLGTPNEYLQDKKGYNQSPFEDGIEKNVLKQVSDFDNQPYNNRTNGNNNYNNHSYQVNYAAEEELNYNSNMPNYLKRKQENIGPNTKNNLNSNDGLGSGKQNRTSYTPKCKPSTSHFDIQKESEENNHSKIRDLERENRNLKEDIANLKNKMIVMEKVQHEDLQMQDKTLEKKYEQLDKQKYEFSRHLEELENSLELERQQNKKLQHIIEEERESNSNYLKKIDEQQRQLSNMESEKSRVIEKHQKVSSTLVEMEKDREHYQRKCEEWELKYQKQSEEFHRDLAVREKQIDQMTQEKICSGDNYEQLSLQLKEVLSEKEKSIYKLNEVEMEKSRLAEKCSRLELNLDHYKDKVNKIESQIKESSRSSEEKYEQLIKKLNSKDEEKQLLQTELSKKQHDINEEISRVSHVEKLLDDKVSETKELRGLIQTLESSLHAKASEIRHLKQTIDEQQQQQHLSQEQFQQQQQQMSIVQSRSQNCQIGRNLDDIDASRISPSRSYMNETTEASKTDEIVSILKKDSRPPLISSRYQPKKDNIPLFEKDNTSAESELVWLSKKSNQQQQQQQKSERESQHYHHISEKQFDGTHDPQSSQQRIFDSPVGSKYQSLISSPDKNTIDRKSRNQTLEKQQHQKSSNTKDSGEKDPLSKRVNFSDINDPATRLMDILQKEQSQTLKERAKSDMNNFNNNIRGLDIIREEDFSAGNRNMQNTANFSSTRQDDDEATSEIKTLDVVEIPLENQFNAIVNNTNNSQNNSNKKDQFLDLDLQNKLNLGNLDNDKFLEKQRLRLMDKINKTPEEKFQPKNIGGGNENTNAANGSNLTDLKSKLHDLQKNKVALEQRMADFEKRLKESKKKV